MAVGSTRPETLCTASIVLATYHRMLSDHRRAAVKLEPPDTQPESPVKSFAAGGLIAEHFMTLRNGLIIADECHMVPAPRIGALLESLLKPQQRLVGLTGTLLREGGGHAVDGDTSGTVVPWPLLGDCVHRETFTQLAPRYLAPVRCVEVSVPVVGDWSAIFKKQPLAAAVCLSRGKWEALEHLLAIHAKDSLLITVERCEQARLIATTFGIPPIDGSVTATQVTDIIERFRKRDILALVATHVLDDSADFPELSVMVQMGGHFASRRQEQQRLGRLLRWGPLKRKRWEQTGERPTFYAIVHEDTVEERMSRHRTKSVPGVEYERLTLADVTSPPIARFHGSDLFGRKAASGTGAQLDALAAAALADGAKMEATCLAMSQRESSMMPGGSSRQSHGSESKHMAKVRAWLRGGQPKSELGDSTDDSSADFESDDGPDRDAATREGGKKTRVNKNPSKRRSASTPVGEMSSDSSSSSSSSSSSTSTSSSTLSAPKKQQRKRKVPAPKTLPKGGDQQAQKVQRPKRTAKPTSKPSNSSPATIAATSAASEDVNMEPDRRPEGSQTFPQLQHSESHTAPTSIDLE